MSFVSELLSGLSVVNIFGESVGLPATTLELLQSPSSLIRNSLQLQILITILKNRSKPNRMKGELLFPFFSVLFSLSSIVSPHCVVFDIIIFRTGRP